MNIRIYQLGCLALLGALTAACSGSGKDDSDSAKAEKLPTVEVATVTSQIVNQTGVYTASAEPEIINNISSSMPNRIKNILVDEGQQVSKGQKLVELDDVNTFAYETQVDNARANLNNVQLNYDRAVQLLAIGGGTQQQVDQMEIQLVNAKNSLAQAERTLRNARENTVLTSPIAGVVTKRNYDPGDMTGNMPVLTIGRTQPVKVVINASESDVPHIHKGMPAEVRFDTYGDEMFQGKVTTVMPTIDTQSRTFGVEISVPNSDSRIMPGMFGRVTLNLGQADHVVVPDKAVVKQTGSGDHYVYVFNPADNTVSFTKVQLGQRLGDTYELVSGVESGSQVVVKGQNRLANGAKVQLAGSAAPAAKTTVAADSL